MIELIKSLTTSDWIDLVSALASVIQAIHRILTIS